MRSTSAVRRYTDNEQDPVEAGRELKVDSVIEGSIQRSGERIRLTVRLVSVRDGRPLWAGKFDEEFKDIFKVQDSISEKVAAALTLKLNGEDKSLLTKRYTENAEAYKLYLKGRYYWNKRSPEGTKKGIEYFEQATALDPDYALAYAGLADSYLMLGNDYYLKAKSVGDQGVGDRRTACRSAHLACVPEVATRVGLAGRRERIEARHRVEP